MTGHVGGGIKWYAPNRRWGLRRDYRFAVTQSKDDAPAFVGREGGPDDRGLDDHACRIAIATATLVLAMRPFRRCAAASRSLSLTMLHRSNTLRVLWPVSRMATRSGTPRRTMFHTFGWTDDCVMAGG